MGPIQGSINQSLTILGALATQSPALRQKAEDRQFDKEYKNLGKQASSINKEVIGELIKTAEAAGNLDEERFKTGIEKYNIGIKDLENIAEQRKNIAIKLGKSEDYSNNVSQIANLNRYKEYNKRNIDLFDKVKKSINTNELYASMAAQNSNNKLSTKQRIKANMDMMKSTLKEDN